MLQKQCEKLQRGEKEGGKKVIFKITCLKCERIFFFFFLVKSFFQEVRQDTGIYAKKAADLQ